ncbi:MAG: fibronectin type III domain-containing protein, partial [Acidobacteria bacterium]|nr:fibronectin type III domain-containing protein [Acidobacteriota bacterium]
MARSSIVDRLVRRYWVRRPAIRAPADGSTDWFAGGAGPRHPGSGRHLVPAIVLAAIACTPTDDRAAELAAREVGNPGGENYGEFGPPDAYEGDSPHPFYGAENEWSRRMFDERSADLYYKRRGQRQLLEILDGNPTRAIELADARLEEDPVDAESLFIKTVALTQLGRIADAEQGMHAAIVAGMPVGRFLAGPRDLLAPLATTESFALHSASPNNAIVHGPMLGAVTDTTASVWVRTAEATRFEVVATADGERHIASGATAADRDYTGTAVLNGLSPDTTYSYQVLVAENQQPPRSQPPGDGPRTPSSRPAAGSTSRRQSQSPTYNLRTSPPAGSPGTFTV